MLVSGGADWLVCQGPAAQPFRVPDPNKVLTALRAKPFRAPEQAADLPTEMLVCPWGDSHALDGSLVRVNEETLRVFAANQAKGFETVALDFEHETYRKDLPEPKVIAANAKPEIRKGEGIYLVDLQWTEQGAVAARGHHYKDLSPVVLRSDAGVVQFLHSVALCRNGQLQGLEFFSASLPASVAPGEAPNATATDNKPTKTKTTNMDSLTGLLTALGCDIPENATDDQLKALAAEQVETLKQAKADADKKPADPAASETDLGKKLDAFTARLDAIEQRGDKDEKLRLIALATNAGKIIPIKEETLLKLSVPDLDEMLKGLPAGQVATSSRFGSDRQHLGGGSSKQGPTEHERFAMKALSISPEDWEKYKPLIQAEAAELQSDN